MWGWTGKGNWAATPITANCFLNPAAAHRRAPLGSEQVRGGGSLLALQPTQGGQLGAAHGVHAGPAVLEPLHMEVALRQVEHVPAQADQFGDPQAVANWNAWCPICVQ